MSHITTVSVVIRDLDALKSAAQELGAQFVEGVKSYRWYGRSVGDTALPEGMTVDQLGKCEHVIRVPGVNYEIGVVRKKDGSYTLAYDFFGDGYDGHDGQKLLNKFGKGCNKLAQMYAVHVATRAARSRGMMVMRRSGKGGAIQLTVSGL